MRPEQIPYGVKDFKRIRLENRYYVDKSAVIRKMEERADFLFFVRPRRFGKSLLCEMLRCYYDVGEKENFERLFGGLAAGADPTPNAGRYVVLSLDFSRVNACTGETWNERFASYMDGQLDLLISTHKEWFRDDEKVMSAFLRPGAEAKYGAIVSAALAGGTPVHFICYEFKGRELVRLEEVDPCACKLGKT